MIVFPALQIKEIGVTIHVHQQFLKCGNLHIPHLLQRRFTHKMLNNNRAVAKKYILVHYILGRAQEYRFFLFLKPMEDRFRYILLCLQINGLVVCQMVHQW